MGDQNVTICTASNLCVGLWTAPELSLDAVYSQFVFEIAEGEVREELWSSINYLVLISTPLINGKNQQNRQGIV